MVTKSPKLPEMPLFFIDPDGNTVPIGFDESFSANTVGVHTPTDVVPLAVKPLTKHDKEFLGLVVSPDWELAWLPLSQRERTLALSGLVGAVERHKQYEIYEASRAHADASRFITSATLLAGPLDLYEGDEQEIDIREDTAALRAIAETLVIQEGAAEDHWVRTGTKSFETKVARKVNLLSKAELIEVLDLAAKIDRAQRMRAAFWQLQKRQLEETPVWQAVATDSQLQRRNGTRG